MKTVDEKDIPNLLSQKIQPIILTERAVCIQMLNDFSILGAEVEKRKAAAKLKKDA